MLRVRHPARCMRRRCSSTCKAVKRFAALRQIAEHVGVMVAGKLTPLASVVVYSRLMSVEDYGVLNVAVSYVWIFAIVMSLNLHVGVGRYAYTASKDFSSCLGTGLIALAVAFALTASFVGFGLPFFERLLGLPQVAIALLLIIVLGTIFESLLSQIAIFNQNSSLILRVAAAKACGTFGLAVVLLAALESDKYLAVLYADAMTSLALAAYVVWSFRSNVRWTFDLRHLRYVAGYAIPLIPYMLSLTLLSQFDRIMIDRYFGKETTGLYSLAYNAGVILLMLVTAVLNVFNPTLFASLDEGDLERVRRDAKSVFAVAVVATTILILFGATLFSWIVPSKYESALELIPIVALSGLAFTIFQVWVRVLAYANKTYLISLIALVSAALNIALNAWLLPLFGYPVAAVTTAVSYLVMSILCVFALNSLVGIMKVNIRAELGYIAALAILLVVFRGPAAAPAVDVALKLAVLAACLWHFRESFVALVRWKPLRRPGAAA